MLCPELPVALALVLLRPAPFFGSLRSGTRLLSAHCYPVLSPDCCHPLSHQPDQITDHQILTRFTTQGLPRLQTLALHTFSHARDQWPTAWASFPSPLLHTAARVSWLGWCVYSNTFSIWLWTERYILFFTCSPFRWVFVSSTYLYVIFLLYFK